MDRYMSTYRKDFIWPYMKSFPMRTEKRSHRMPDYRSRCVCGEEPGDSVPPNEYVGPPTVDYQWSRLGPMAPLLDPKLYPAKVGPAPEFEITRRDQPNTYLKKLEEKYPHLYNVLQSAPPDEMIQRVNEDRLRTTYQTDYGYVDENPLGDYEKTMAPAGTTHCPNDRFRARETLPILDCRERLRPPQDYSYDPEANLDIAAATGYRDDENGFRDRAKVGIRPESGRREFGDDSRDVKNDAGGRRESLGRDVRSRPDEGAGSKAMKGRPSNEGRGEVGRGDGGGARGQVGGEGRKGENGGGSNRGRGPESGPGARNVEGRSVGGVGPTGRNESGQGGVSSGAMTMKANGGSGAKEGGEVKSKKMKKMLEDEEASKKPLPPWSSEYREVIGQTGMSIMKDKMHQHGGRSSGRSFIERIVMKCRS